MEFFRILHRAALLVAHVLIGLTLTPFVSYRADGGGRRTHPCVTSWWQNRLGDILGLEITLTGYPPQPPALMVSNHISWIDIVVLGGLTPTVFLSKQEVRHWPVVGWLSARAGTLFIRRGHGNAGTVKDRIAHCLRHDGMLTLFPEGTTTDGREVRPFFSRLFAAAIESDTAVVPVALRYHIDGAFDPVAPYTGDQSIGANLLGLLRRPRTQVHVAFGDPIRLAGQTRREIARLAHDAVVSALEAPRPLTGIDPARVGQSAMKRGMITIGGNDRRNDHPGPHGVLL